MPVQFNDIRNGPEQLDGKFRALVASLDTAYYKHWRENISLNWHGYDKLSTKEQSKELFDKLHGILWNIYSLCFHILNQEREVKFPESAYRYTYDDNNNIISDKLLVIKNKFSSREQEDDVNTLISLVESLFSRSFDISSL